MDARALPPPFAPPRSRQDGASSLPPQYEFLRVLGCGGMGTTVLARERSLGRLIVIKRVRESCMLFLERFEREARIMARLVHPAIVPIHAFGRWREQPYFAMRYVRGGSVAVARQAPRTLISTLRPVVDALELAHANGIVHRDVKPENILLDERGRAYLTDFGLALDAREGVGVVDQRPIAGTPLTMSPEQIGGERVGPASDVFSLGVTLYRQLTGEWPFRGRTIVDVLRAIREDAPARPRSLAPELPRALETLLLRCLAKDPSARYGSMAELGRAFDRFLEGRTWLGLAFPTWASTRRARRGGEGRSIHPEELS